MSNDSHSTDYEVERVLNHTNNDGAEPTLYIKWANTNEYSWEPLSVMLEEISELVQDYLLENQLEVEESPQGRRIVRAQQNHKQILEEWEKANQEDEIPKQEVPKGYQQESYQLFTLEDQRKICDEFVKYQAQEEKKMKEKEVELESKNLSEFKDQKQESKNQSNDKAREEKYTGPIHWVDLLYIPAQDPQLSYSDFFAEKQPDGLSSNRLRAARTQQRQNFQDLPHSQEFNHQEQVWGQRKKEDILQLLEDQIAKSINEQKQEVTLKIFDSVRSRPGKVSKQIEDKELHQHKIEEFLGLSEKNNSRYWLVRFKETPFYFYIPTWIREDLIPESCRKQHIKAYLDRCKEEGRQ